MFSKQDLLAKLLLQELSLIPLLSILTLAGSTELKCYVTSKLPSEHTCMRGGAI